jgi:hypothetical protein
MKLFIAIVSVIVAAPLLAAPATEPAHFNLSSPAAIPGAVLDSGPYTIRIINRLSDRVILRIDGGAFHSTFIGIPNKEIEKPSVSGSVRWAPTALGPISLRGWYFAGTPSVVEFVYPKAAALAIASSNPLPVPAIDPASEGKVADNALSQNDMQLLTLWLLSVEKVRSGDQAPNIKAVRYQHAALANQKPLVDALPHTASLIPVVWLIGFFSIFAAASMRIVSMLRRSAFVHGTNAGGNHAQLRNL